MKDLQQKVKNFCKENNLDTTVEHRMLDLVSEIGEVSKEVLKMSNYGKSKITYRKEFESELGDVLFSLIAVANTFDVDLEKALEQVLEKYKRRLNKGSAGSEND